MTEWREILDLYGLPLAGTIGVFAVAYRIVRSFADGSIVPGYIYTQEREARMRSEAEGHNVLQDITRQLEEIRRSIDQQK